MNERYIPYDYSKPMLLIYGLGYPLGMLILFFTSLKMVTADVSSLILPILLIPITICIIGIAPRFVKCRFIADEYSVTFKQPLSKDIVISYLNVEDISIYNKKVRTHSIKGGGRSFYVEKIVIKTYDKEYIFHNEMDIIVSGRMEALGIMDKMFEMGKFSVLKKYISIQKEKMML